MQLNVAFREPLSAGLRAEDVQGVADDEVDLEHARRRVHTDLPVAELAPDEVPGTVVVAGHDAGEDAERIAWELGAPLLAEVSSGARFGRNLVVAYRDLLRDADFGGAVRRAVVLGHPTLSREVPALLQRDDVETVVVRGPGADPYDPARASRPSAETTFVSDVRVTGRTTPAHRAWVGRWVATSRALLGDGDAGPDLDAKRSADRTERNRFLRDEVALRRRAVDREMLVEAVWGATWPHDRLVLGASQLIRVADAHVAGKKLRVHANRGLAGIDGTVSTALGIAAALDRSPDSIGTTRVLVGDLTFLHDLGAFVTGTEERRHRVQVVVGNDGGGAIFRGLEVAATTPEQDMRRMMTTPQQVDVERVVTGLGWSYRRAATWGDLEAVLTDPRSGWSSRCRWADGLAPARALSSRLVSSRRDGPVASRRRRIRGRLACGGASRADAGVSRPPWGRVAPDGRHGAGPPRSSRPGAVTRVTFLPIAPDMGSRSARRRPEGTTAHARIGLQRADRHPRADRPPAAAALRPGRRAPGGT